MDRSNVTKLLKLPVLTGTITDIYYTLTAKELGLKVVTEFVVLFS
jgi:hypothetical protein